MFIWVLRSIYRRQLRDRYMTVRGDRCSSNVGKERVSAYRERVSAFGISLAGILSATQILVCSVRDESSSVAGFPCGFSMKK